ncbi:RNA polymerase II transcription factor SIII subunit A3-like-1 [Cricetulus griseus]|uniref:RNA polymerase II transcription factor SIII subunit A3-like-1 n=1 Tax=Cricetulus griseus TaxID=10029 RepID=G3IP55_CRIGR|nr:RNA polymerase II transcription factor SIII subunit A3-like-1 [Cricetulus griseus]
MEMEHTSRLEALLKLHDRLCRETEPRQLYKTLKKLSSQPMLGDQIGFRQTIKLLKKQQLLPPFAKEIAAQWSERYHFGSQADPRPPQDFAFHRRPKAEIRSNSPEDELQNPAFLRPRENGSQVLEVSSSSPQHSTTESMDTSSKQIPTGSPNMEPAGRRTQRVSFRDNQLDTESKDFAFHWSPKAEIRSNSPEDEMHNPAFLTPRKNGSQMLEVNSSSPQHSTTESMDTSSKQIATGSPNTEPAGKRIQRVSFRDSQLDKESQVGIGKPQGTVWLPWLIEVMKTPSSKPEDGPAKQRLALLRAKSPGPWNQKDHPPSSSEASFNYDCSPSSSALPPRKRKRKSTWKAEAQSPGAKVPRDKSPSCKERNLLLAARRFPETTANLQTCFPQDRPEHSSLHTDPA